MHVRFMPFRSLAAAFVVSAIVATPVRAERAAGISVALPQALVLFDTAAPTAATVRTLTGLSANESMIGVDVRPSTGQLFGLTVTAGSANNSLVHTYAIDPETGVASPVGQTAAALSGAGDVPSDIDFNPKVDRIRLVNTNDENARIDPGTGTLAGDDADLTPAVTVAMIAVAYDRNVVATSPTTLYGINRDTSQLVTQGGIDSVPSPNSGQITAVGSLGFTLDATSDGGLDITPAGTAYAALTDDADDRPRLYTIDLATGAATVVGDLPVALRSLAIVPESPPPADTTAPAGLVDVGASPRLKTLQDSGLPLAFSCNEACTASATLVARDTVVARGDGSVSEAGVGQLTLTAASEGAKVLRKAKRTKKLRGTLTVTFTDGAANISTRERAFDLPR